MVPRPRSFLRGVTPRRSKTVVPDAYAKDLLQVVDGGILPVEDWDAVYRDHVVPVYRFVYVRVGNRPDAEDVTSSVFERALPRLRTGATVGQLRSYLIATAKTVLADHWRGRFGVDELPDETADRPQLPTSDNHSADVERILNGLPSNYRDVLQLRFLRGYSLKETAHEMGTTIGNVKVMQLRALRRAAQEFEL